jgi:hypothetical protein
MMPPAYFLISVSNRRNLELCIKHALAGFTNSITGVWTFCEVREGDFVSFLYAARAHNLYRVVGREAIKNADALPPWPPITFRESGRTYYFPFRLHLKPIREFTESLVRPEFAYVAENLLLRAGYRKTHFQADQTTLQSVSQMGDLWNGPIKPLEMPEYSIFTPLFTRQPDEVNIPLIFPFREIILQATIRQHLVNKSNLAAFLNLVGVNTLQPAQLEVLGEKAVPEGHIDILIKESVPIGLARKVIVEVKLRRGQESDLAQLADYMNEFGNECITGVLIAESFSRAVIAEAGNQGIKLVRYRVKLDWSMPRTFDEIRQSLQLEAVRGEHK